MPRYFLARAVRICTLAIMLTLCSAAGAQDKPREPDAALVQRIFDCMSAGLSDNWQRAWVVVTERSRAGAEREFDSSFRFSESAEAGKEAGKETGNDKPLVPCKAESTIEDVFRLNPELMSKYREAKLVFFRDGRFELRFDNPQ